MNHWKIFCMEDEWPGLWQLWFKEQCVTLGWPPPGYKYRFDAVGKGDRKWSTIRHYLRDMEPGDKIVVHLRGNRVGGVGEIVRKRIADEQWSPLITPSRAHPKGEQGRRILVRWNLNATPKSSGWVTELPDGKGFSRGAIRPAISRIDAKEFNAIQFEALDPGNRAPLAGHEFLAEDYLSDYIGTYPSRLEEGLTPYPSAKVRERVFKNGSRADILLIDEKAVPVVVECKKGMPSVADIRQIRGYMALLKQETSVTPRGILVHGGSRKVRPEVERESNRKPRVELVHYALTLDFTSSNGRR